MQLSRMRLALAAAVLAATGAMALWAAGTIDGPTHAMVKTSSGSPGGTAEAVAQVEQWFQQRDADADVAGPGHVRTLDEMLPTVTFAHPNSPSAGPMMTATATQAVVGRITAVDEGKGFWPGPGKDDAPDGQVLDYADSRAMWRDVHATVEVDHCLGCSVPAQITVVLPSTGPDKFPILHDGLIGLGRVVLFLRDDSPLSAYAPGLYSPIMVATVADDGSLALPFIAPGRAASLLGPRGMTLAQLEQSSQTPRAIPLVEDHNSHDGDNWRRVDGR